MKPFPRSRRSRRLSLFLEILTTGLAIETSLYAVPSSKRTCQHLCIMQLHRRRPPDGYESQTQLFIQEVICIDTTSLTAHFIIRPAYDICKSKLGGRPQRATCAPPLRDGHVPV